MNQEKFIKLIRKLFLIACVGVIFGGFLVFAFPAFIFFAALFFAESKEFLKNSSPDGKYILSAQSSGGGIMYGSSDLQIYQIGNNSGKKKILATSIKNDGANLSSSNVSFTWIDNRQVLLKLDGEQQEPTCYLVKVGEKPSHVEKDCPKPSVNKSNK